MSGSTDNMRAEAPSIEELCFDAPLYRRYMLPAAGAPARPAVSRVQIGGPSTDVVQQAAQAARFGPGPLRWDYAGRLASFDGTVDRYCIACKRESVFQAQPLKTVDSPLLVKRFACTRKSEHRPHDAVFIFEHDGDSITKIGQRPSGRDLYAGALARYRKTLGDDLFPLLQRAVALEPHGMGIGSFVYLRRVLEALIEQAHAEATQGEGWNEETYRAAKMPEKIGMLERWLPGALTSHKALYRIFSKGIHELEEDECLEHFLPLRTHVELILDERISKEEQARKKAESAAKIAAIEGKLSQRNSGR